MRRTSKRRSRGKRRKPRCQITGGWEVEQEEAREEEEKEEDEAKDDKEKEQEKM